MEKTKQNPNKTRLESELKKPLYSGFLKTQKPQNEQTENSYVEKEFVWKPYYKCQNITRTAYTLIRKVLHKMIQ